MYSPAEHYTVCPTCKTDMFKTSIVALGDIKIECVNCEAPIYYRVQVRPQPVERKA